MRHTTRRVEVVERELGAVIARIEAARAQVDGVRPVGDGCPHGVERPGGGQEFRDAPAYGARPAGRHTLA
jgi:hypothetical protein